MMMNSAPLPSHYMLFPHYMLPPTPPTCYSGCKPMFYASLSACISFITEWDAWLGACAPLHRWSSNVCRIRQERSTHFNLTTKSVCWSVYKFLTKAQVANVKSCSRQGASHRLFGMPTLDVPPMVVYLDTRLRGLGTKPGTRDGNKVQGMHSNFSRMLLHKFNFE